MADSSQGSKIVPISRGFARRAANAKRASNAAAPPPSPQDPVQQLLRGLDARVNAILVARPGGWEFFERLREDPHAASLLAYVTLPDLIGILNRSRSRGEDGERITLSPWKGFDLAVLLRDGEPRYAAAFTPETSIYVAEATLPLIARFFDERSRAAASLPATPR